ncbi:unnamed protein product [Thelazia callipaeda]|uniref:Uncharacterized protein n=1 Tax=Thelazia callipaeda TaxID=103827 RepID=A0A0N5CSW9_THECL|nr:unnamed protein product [Thelazia callipaeda]
MHDKGSGLERLTSIPNLLKLTGSKDFEQWLNLFVEASGVSDAIDKIKGDEGHNRLPPGYKSMRRGIDGQPLYFLKENLTEIDPKMIKKVELFENLTLSLTPKQLAEFKITGYSLMTRDQLAMVYGSKSPMSNMKTLEFFLSLNEDQMRDRIIHDIRGLATSKSLVKIRYKRQILQPSALTASILNPGNDITVLSPSALSLTLLSPSVFGLTVLSPELFTATLLSPSVLSPSVLSPKALAPVFLSPSALSPSFLSPVLLSPVFLSPTFLSPRVLSPALLSPAILSPFALNPAIFAPTAYGGIVASPFALSPAIFSPSQNNLVLFSPSIYSPTFNSTGVNNLVLFSPSVGS